MTKQMAQIFTLLLPLVLLLCGISSSAAPPPGPGLADGRLRPCPNSPNCLNSETPGAPYIAPLPYTSPPGLAWRHLQETIAETGGAIVTNTPGYLHAVYTSRLWRFVDDVEFRLDESAGVIQVRSASRSGYWDLGVNRRRVERIRRLFAAREESGGR